MTKSKISNTEWGLVIAALFVIDGIQWLLIFFAIGFFLNEFIELFTAMSFTLYLWMRGEMDWQRMIAQIVAYLGGAATDGAAPLWGLDGIYQMLWSKGLEKAEEISPLAGKVVKTITKDK